MTDRKAFFDKARASLFGGTLDQRQVDGMTMLIDMWDETGETMPERLAYVLATAYHEARVPPLWKPEMQPVEEVGRGIGRPYGVPDARTGLIYYGRGLVQLTWYDNYAKLGTIVGAALVSHPERALEPELSARILIEGMRRGAFCPGHALATHFPEGGPPDWIGARRIINGSDRAETIAGYAQHFADALATLTA